MVTSQPVVRLITLRNVLQRNGSACECVNHSKLSVCVCNFVIPVSD